MIDDPHDAIAGVVTADDVATAAGVSRWTVNRAFKKEASISAKTREKVMAAAEQLGYVPDLLAASLASDHSNLVALLVDDFNNPHKLVMLERLTRILRQNGWDTLLVNMLDENDAHHALLSASQRRVDAAILIGIQFDDDVIMTALGARRVKKLIVFARTSHHPNTISIAVDDVAAMTDLTHYVLEKGYERPVFLAGPPTQSAHLMRKETFLATWQDARGAAPEILGTVASYDPALAQDVVVAALSGMPPAELPDIIVCENDALALGTIDGIRHGLGLRVPEDIAVTGFDDVPQAGAPNYDLTTYRQPVTAMAETLVEVLQNRGNDANHTDFRGKIVVRGSA